MERSHLEDHFISRTGWLRAAVLGANDGIVSTASLIMGVAAAAGRAEVLLAGAALPLAAAALVPEASISVSVAVLTIFFLALLGAVGAKAGGAPPLRAVLRVTFWGAAAMGVTTLVGKLFGATIG